ncbi:hypothetical protein MNBD_ACTINO02-1991 [hydrothermal vent metagenome]|uniref:HipA-like C-terminal domain-containing protein n=1 Tax=hydrothermal vent metagenome TaxID=652676 RepID=A0A3B0S423_9ZZZZ
MFEVVDVTDWETASTIEPIGTRPKQWLLDGSGSSWLFKEARSDDERPSGQDWAEKAVAELAKLLEVPAATVELARRSGTRGVISRNFVNKAASLVHGNELLSANDPAYPQDQLRNDTPGYNVAAIRDVLGPYVDHAGGTRRARSAFDGFFGYLVLDAWVNNTDRHHRNWGIVLEPTGSLAPSFDHGSSLAFGITDTKRASLLAAGDDEIRRWLERGQTRSFEGMPAMLDITVAGWEFIESTERTVWIDRLTNLRDDDVDEVLDRIPADGLAGVVLSDVSRTLCKEILRINRLRLLDALTTH